MANLSNDLPFKCKAFYLFFMTIILKNHIPFFEK